MSSVLIRNARLENEGREFDGDLLVSNGRIVKIASSIHGEDAHVEIDAQGQWLVPGMIDDQVHFRDPGAPDKGSFYTESRAAVVGGITSFMDMPNTNPATLTLAALADKKRRAAINSVANYGFHFGVSNDNLDTVAALNPCEVAGVKVFMGASTGNMLVDDPQTLERLFAEVPTILDRDYPSLGNLIKCNPAIKTQADRNALRQALMSNRLDVIGSDHAPHTWAEKQRPYHQAPSGLPLVQHALPALMELVIDEVLPITTLVAKTSHRVADLFAIPDRGYLREGYWADLVLIKPEPEGVAVSRQPILSQCGWTPFARQRFRHSVSTTIVSGQIAWHYKRLNDNCQGLPLRLMR